MIKPRECNIHSFDDNGHCRGCGMVIDPQMQEQAKELANTIKNYPAKQDVERAIYLCGENVPNWTLEQRSEAREMLLYFALLSGQLEADKKELEQKVRDLERLVDDMSSARNEENYLKTC